MKKISSRFSIAVHILSLVSLSSLPCTSDFIASSVNTNPVIIRRIIGQLKHAGLVYVKAGTGGTYLRKELDQITLLDVYKAVEVVEKGDLFNFHEHPNPVCPVGANIESVLRSNMLRAQSAMEQELAQVTLKQLVTELGEKKGS
ncbi:MULTISPECIES: Rrf2 family transcriptional regulator [unclassified Paenibacillus]|uniref:Rrf2 family transcriptional regulator n=1 Tax=unclassified Paenibacillus TaxID=185978 RepID=UPI001AE1D858|nr:MULTISPECIES: Rrf2 family transcriptional regulator [unclassified Paenibacillus]MBP1157222.1 DNA-binding IscR family transcriptional regulator [Paenibacillus sp. PvP091]MBP1172039.1 DNA-binding IscR family transcriptional regulator [Paenibacillus sp. PvR098]MBP2438420.1 DNA-binding IscR family transcriptional regulator [Paenibacillus sp. PvP052]